MGKTLSTRMAFGEELLKIAETNENFVVCNADTKTCGLEKFGQRFPEREFSFGIAEQDLVGSAAGLAACGNKVFLATFATFASMRACEQVRTFVCHPNLNVTIIGTHAGLQVGGDGATHAAIEDVAIMRAFPNMTVVQPADAVAARAIAHAAVDFTGPLYVRLHRNPVDDVYDGKYQFSFGKAHTAAEFGTDLTMIVSGILLGKALEAAARLNAMGIGVRVLDMATIKPLDDQLVLKAARECGKVITCEEHSVIGGLGEAVCALLSEQLPPPVRRIGVNDEFGHSGPAAALLKQFGLCAEHIAEVAKDFCK